MATRHDRAAAIADAAGADALVVAEPAAVTWLSGLAPELETGPSPFSLPALAIVPRVGGSRPHSNFANVDLPDPLAPTTAMICPRRSSKFTARSASTSAPGYR